MKIIPPEQFLTRPIADFAEKWFLLTAGDFAAGRFNTMTVSWGTIGYLWAKPVVQVFARPQRRTREFLDAYPAFTLSVLPEKLRPAYQLLGAKSGYEFPDKIAQAGLTPVASATVAAPCFAEAELVIEAKKLFAQKLKPESFFDPAILAEKYPGRDYHTQYFGEILAIRSRQ